MDIVFSKAQVEKDPKMKALWNSVASERQMFNNRQAAHGREMFAAGMNPQMVGNVGAAQIPTDAWRQYDEMTQRVFRDDEGSGYMSDLMDLAKGISIGKTVNLYRYSTDLEDNVTRSMSGQEKPIVDHVNYDYEGDPVPIFMNAYGRPFREWASHMSENFDSMADDHEASMAGIKQNQAQYILDGDSKVSVQGRAGQGIRNHRNRQAISLAGIDLASTSTTSDQVYNHFATGLFGQAYLNNRLNKPMKLWVSREIYLAWQREYSGSQGFKGQTLWQVLHNIGFIDSINFTYELSGNEYFAYSKDQKYIRPLIGAAMSTVAITRNMFNDPYNFMNWGAMGLQIKRDTNGRSGVFYASA